MAQKPSRVTSSSGLIALLSVLMAVIAGYSFYLLETHQALDFQAQMLSPSPFMVKPGVVVQLISSGGFVGTFVAVAVHAIHKILIVAIVFTLVMYGVGYWKKKSAEQALVQAAESELKEQIFKAEIPGSQMLLSLNDNYDPLTGERILGIVDNEPYNQNFFRIDAKRLTLKRQPTNPLEHLQQEILEILAAHEDVPASIGNHHADASLAEHSKDVARKVKVVMHRIGKVDPLTTLVGLAHDLEKLVAYKRNGTNWVKNSKATHHNTYSAYIVRHLPSFKLLDKDDQHVLTMVLRYYHHPAQLPLNSGERVENLMRALREADGWGLREEREKGVAAAKDNPNTQSLLSDAITQFFSDADINRFKGGQFADGWTVHAVEYVAVPNSTLLEKLHKFLPLELTKQLNLNVETRRFGHVATEVIRETFRAMGLLIEEHKDIVSPTGLFDMKVGQKTFSACFLLNKDGLQELLPTTVPKWGNSQHGLKVRRATLASVGEEDEDDEE